MLVKSIYTQNEYKEDKLDNWKGGDFLLREPFDDDSEGKPTHSILMATLHQMVISETHKLSCFRFLGSPWTDGPALIQSVWVPIDSDVNAPRIDPMELFKKGAEDVMSLRFDEFLLMAEHFYRIRMEFGLNVRLPLIGKFKPPYQDKFSYGLSILNFDHANTKNIIGLFCAIILAGTNNNKTAATLNDLIDEFNDLPYFDYSIEYEGVSMKEINETLEDIAKSASRESIYNSFVPETVSIESFVDKSLVRKGNVYLRLDVSGRKVGDKFNKDYSMPL
jgi:hypothetical protein